MKIEPVPTDNRPSRLCINSNSDIKGYLFTPKADDELRDAEILGTGGSSVVYKAYQALDRKRGITVPRAIKFFVMREDLVASDADTTFMAAQDNFLEEVQNISQLAHENLVQVIDAGEYDLPQIDGSPKRVPFLVTHLISGCTLRDIIEGRPQAAFAISRLKESPEIAVRLLVQVASGLGYLHSKKFLHCDIAPKNIFVEDAEPDSLRAIVGDVGMSRCLTGNGEELLFIAGTRSYSPASISDQFGHSVRRKDVANWFPGWDSYGFAKTACELLNHMLSLTSVAWVRSATSKAEQAFREYQRTGSPQAIAELIEYCLPIHRQRGGVPELESNSVGARKRMMPIEGMAITKRVDSVVRHPAILRLQGVPQLTIVRSAAPGGNHTRYEHSLGVMENMRRMLSSLIDEPSFLGILRRESIETGLVAALLYNSTRFPFSNVIHEINKRLPPGSAKPFSRFGREGLLDDVFGDAFRSLKGKTLLDEIREGFPAVDLLKLMRILTGTNSTEFVEQDEAVLHALLNSSLDARVVDFVRRDSLHLGLSSGDLFNMDDLLPHLTVSPAIREGMPVRVTLKSSGVSVAEQIVLMRYWLYQRVYWNQPNRCYNAMIRRVLLDLQACNGFEDDLREVALNFDEREMLHFLEQSAAKLEDTSTQKLIRHVVGYEKILYREVFETNIRQCESAQHRRDLPMISRLVSEMMSYAVMREYEIALNEFSAKQFNLDTCNEAPLVLLDVPFEPGNIKMGTDIFVTFKSASASEPDARSLDQVSPVIAGVNTNFTKDLQRLRIFLRPDIRAAKDDAQAVYGELLRIAGD